MPSASTLSSEIGTIFDTTWNLRDGQVIPKTDEVALKNGAVKIDAAVLYADLFHSTTLARQFPNTMAGKIVRAYLSSMTRLVTANGGVVRSFDGDRVMGVFVGGTKNSQAAKCALQMKYVVDKILKPKAEAKFSSLKAKGFRIAHCVGIHRSEILVIRGGVRGTNDLVFIGSAPNLAAKLSDIRNPPFSTYITHHVHSYLKDYAKYGGSARDNMWARVKVRLGDEDWTCYRSSWHWEP